MKALIKDIVVKNQEAAHKRAAKYYLNRTLSIPINSWVWIYNPRASPPEGDPLPNRKLAVAWAGPYLFLGMHNRAMAKAAKVDDGGQIIRRFLVHGSKVRLCHWSGKDEGEQELWRIRPGLLPDFPDSEVSAPLYQADEHEEEERRLEVSVRSTR